MRENNQQLDEIVSEENALQRHGGLHNWHWLIICLSLILTFGA